MNSSKEEFAHLHIHNEYSLLDGYGTAQQYVERAKQLGMEHLALTNHMNVDGCVRWQQACDEAGIHSILGCEMYLVEDIKYRPPRDKTQRRERTYHITLLARNQDGWKSILHLLTQANLHGFYYRPRIDPSLLLENCSGLIIMSACASSFIQTEWGRGLLEDLVGKSLPVYLEVMPHNYKDQVEVNALALSLAKEYGLPIVATNDCHYVERGQEKLQEVLLAIQRNAKWNDPNRWKFDVTGLYLRTRKEMVEAFTTQGVLKRKEIMEALDNTLMVAEQCTLHLERIPVVLPHVPVPGKEGLSDEDKLIELALDGLYEKAEHHKEIGTSIEEYEERLKEELELVIKLGFARYFLIVWELIRWCKENDIMTGPGRGSVGGSLLAYVLGITKVNPLKYNLLFARFISPARIDLPDIDMDFEDIKRDLIREHLEKLYGKYNVAGVSTFAALHGRGALRDVSRVFSVSPKDVDAAAKSIVVRSGGDVRASFTIEDAFNTFEDGIKFKKKYPEVSRIAMALEGQKVRAGMHAAAICIAGHDLRDALCANLVRRKQGTICVNWDKEDAEFNGLMKLDVLGLKALTILNYCAKLIKERHRVEIDFEKIPLDDKEVYDQFTQGNTIGCFQFNTPGMIKLCKEIGIEDFNQLTDLNALHRPGCLRSGMTVDYRLRKHGQQEIPKVHPFIEKLTKDTRGLILYQEQVMNLLYDLGGLPWRTADTVRKVISKSKGVEQFKKFESLFIEGCQKRKTLPPSEAKKVFDELKHFGSYGFNKSHAVEYAMIGYWDMWLKVHYPAEFMVAVLTYGTDLKKRDCIMELRRLGLKFILPNVNESKAEEWAINKSGALVVPLCEIKGIGPAAAKAIEKERLKNGAYKSLDDLQSRLPKRTVNSRVIKTLSAVGALFFKEEDRPQFSEEELERLSEYFSFELSSDPMYRFRKLLRVLKTSLSIRPLNSVNFLRTERESSLYFGRMTQIKFGYREKVQNVITDKARDIKGTKGALGGVYGNFEDQTDFAMLVFGSKVYQERKEEIEHCSGRWLLAKANHPYRTSSLHTEEFWFVEDLESANTRGLSLRLAKTLSPRQRRELERLGEAMSACEHCSLRKECSQVVRPSIGNLNACIIGEAPGRQEDRVGEGFVGGGGEVLWTELGKKFNLTRKDFYITNVQKCWPSETKTPKPSQIDICSKYWLSRELSIVKPFLVLALGNTVNYFFRQESSGINALSGTVEWSPKYGCWIAWCIHPAAVIYNRAQNYQTFSEGISRWAETLYNLGFA